MKSENFHFFKNIYFRDNFWQISLWKIWLFQDDWDAEEVLEASSDSEDMDDEKKDIGCILRFLIFY